MLSPIALEDIVAGKLVLVGLPRETSIVQTLRGCGAKDVLVLRRDGPAEAMRRSDHAEGRFSSLKDISENNCQIAILEAAASLALLRKTYFWRSRFEAILVPRDGRLLALAPSLLHQLARNRLAVWGASTIEAGGRRRSYLVLSTRRKAPNIRHLYAPAGLTPRQICAYMEGVNYVVLRWVESVEEGTDIKDIDILVADAELGLLRDRLSQEVGVFGLDVYTETGLEGHNFAGAPYFMPGLAGKILASAETRPSGVRAASARWRYLSLCYHLLFHGKSRQIDPGASKLHEDIFGKPKHVHELQRLAGEAGMPIPQTLDDLDTALRENGVFPGADLLGFYARRNPFVAGRYVNSKRSRPGLVVFFLRDMESRADLAPEVGEQLKRYFRILAHGPVTDTNRAAILSRVRGGKWRSDKGASISMPVYWFVCWDDNVRSPRGRPRRKFPNLDNQNSTVFKHRIRKELGGRNGNGAGLLHSSDNTDEALEHIDSIGIAHDPAVEAVVRTLRA